MEELSKRLFEFECEAIGEDLAWGLRSELNKLKTLKDVKEYYLYERDWESNNILVDTLFDFLIDLQMEQEY